MVNDFTRADITAEINDIMKETYDRDNKPMFSSTPYLRSFRCMMATPTQDIAVHG
jgi:hypothetical protein